MRVGEVCRFAIVVGMCFAVAGGCCRQRKGLILHGDWSLELNRVSHMASKGPRYTAGCCAPASCTEPACSCTTGSCTAGGCANGCTCGGHARSDGQGLHDAGGIAQNYGDGYDNQLYADNQRPAADHRSGGYGSGLHGSGGRELGGFGFGGFRAHGAATQMPTPPAPARFQPVPTRPVFEPQLEYYGATVEAPSVPTPESLRAADAVPPAVSYDVESFDDDADEPPPTSLRVLPASYTAYSEPEPATVDNRSTLRFRTRVE